MDKFVCPHCQEDIREVGYWQAEDVTNVTAFYFNEESEKYCVERTDTGAIADSFNIYCSGCDGRLPVEMWTPLQDLQEW